MNNLLRIYNFYDFHFWILFLVFIFFALLSVAIGHFVLSKIKMPSIANSLYLLLSLSIGVLLWLYTGYILGYVNFRGGSYLLILIGILLLTKNRKTIFNLIYQSLRGFLKTDKLLLFVSIVGILVQLYVVSLSGLRTTEGVVFHSLNGVDGIMHAAFGEFMVDTFPPIEPGMSGIKLTNYHYWSDFFNAEIGRIFSIPVIHLNYQFAPLLVSMGMLLGLYHLIILLNGKIVHLRWGVFLHFFAGNGTYIFSLILHHNLGFNTPAFDLGILHFFNTPQAWARYFMYIALIFIILWIKSKNYLLLFTSIPIIAALFGFKIYYGIYITLVLFVLQGVYLLNKIIRKNNNLNLRKITLLILLLILLISIIYLPANSNSGGLFWAPLFWPKLLLGASYLDWNEWWLRMQVYEAYRNYKYIISYNFLAIAIFLISFLGTRIIGIIPIKLPLTTKVGIKFWEWSLFIPAYAVVFISLFYLQISGGANIFNFLVVVAAIANIISAFGYEKIRNSMRSNILKHTFVIMIMTLSIIRPLHDAISHIDTTVNNKARFLVDNNELEAFNYIRQNTDKNSVVQAHPNNRTDAWETPYVAYFSDRSSYLASQGILESHNQKVVLREKEIIDLFATDSISNLPNKMSKLNINYLYLLLDDPLQNTFYSFANSTIGIKTFFKNYKCAVIGLNTDF